MPFPKTDFPMPIHKADTFRMEIWFGNCHALARWENELYNMIMGLADVICMKLLDYVLSLDTKAIYAAL